MRLQPADGPGILRELFLRIAEFARMDDAPVAVRSNGELRVKHLMNHQVFHDVARNVRRVEPAVEGDGSEARVVVPEDGARSARAPAQAHDFNLPLEITPVQASENHMQIEEAAWAGAPAGASAAAPGQIDARADRGRQNVTEVNGAGFARGRAAKEPSHQDFRDRVEHQRRRRAKNICNARRDQITAQPDGAAHARKGVKGHAEGRRGALQAQAPERALEGRLERGRGPWLRVQSAELELWALIHSGMTGKIFRSPVNDCRRLRPPGCLSYAPVCAISFLPSRASFLLWRAPCSPELRASARVSARRTS